jgi:hypothetical protein
MKEKLYPRPYRVCRLARINRVVAASQSAYTGARANCGWQYLISVRVVRCGPAAGQRRGPKCGYAFCALAPMG